MTPNAPQTDPQEAVHSDLSKAHATEVVRRLQEAGYTALWAGGCVRDLLLGQVPSDYDVATNAIPDEVRHLFGERNTLAVGASFGVIVVKGRRGAEDVEVATFRTEGPYLDGRRPERVIFSTPEEDAQRRDFTINGLFFDPLAGQLFDYVGGREDLQRRVLRAIGDPRERFTEDKLRILRAVRISARFGCELETRTAEAVREMAPEILVVSQERIAQELQKILAHPSRRMALERAVTLGVLPVILPELTRFVANVKSGSGLPRDVANWLRGLESLPSPDFELALAVLLRPVGEGRTQSELRKVAEAVCRRLKLSNSQIEQTGWLLEHEGRVAGLPQARASIQKRLLAHPWSRNLVALARAVAVGEEVPPTAAAWCDQYLDQTPRDILQPLPVLTGDDLKRMELVPGKEFKTILEEVYDAQLEGRVTTREDAQTLAWECWTRLRGGASTTLGRGPDSEQIS
jgi:poly(A) polymerase